MTTTLTEIVVTSETTDKDVNGNPVRHRVAYLDAARAIEGCKALTDAGFKIVGVEEKPRKTYARKTYAER